MREFDLENVFQSTTDRLAITDGCRQHADGARCLALPNQFQNPR